MIRSLCLRQAQLVCTSSPICSGSGTRLTRCAPRTISSIELSPLLVRRFSWSTLLSKLKPTPKPGPKPAKNASKQKPKTTQALVYHAGVPRIMFLGILKVTTVFVFGFFAAVTIPRCIESGSPWWQIAGLAVASVAPLLSVWFLTSPMVMWMHMRIPKAIAASPKDLVQYAQSLPPTAEINILTMAPLGNARKTKTTLGELRPTTRRFGLVNYVRDATRENAERKWYHFRAVREFKIEDGLITTTKSREKWIWYTIWSAFSGRKAAKLGKRSLFPTQNLGSKRPATEEAVVGTKKPFNTLPNVDPERWRQSQKEAGKWNDKKW